jgi:hypothetical protein
VKARLVWCLYWAMATAAIVGSVIGAAHDAYVRGFTAGSAAAAASCSVELNKRDAQDWERAVDKWLQHHDQAEHDMERLMNSGF